ncbi:uncharacterized protein XM38_023100 [Halomicronema hongdechloris C2206]|uniref:Uncharacterized protein n=1 Tax=Halomicronema hongdechloris C2206 TaxID=1641165 RepID=A0A1Z3HM47_9CYAN|nr:hypothetical protein [Halomicronema hongdechloris]ASC71358.1 uncharacterized protein XM38_023100 [Halomicronema hongdechloris C2206]
MTPEQEQHIAELRQRQLSPKQIARNLGLRPAEVKAVIQAQAKATTQDRIARGELPPLEQCLINEHAAQQLLDPSPEASIEDGVGGLAQVFVVRREGMRYLVASYLVDYWCLGVKDAMGPQRLNQTQYTAMVEKAYDNFHQSSRVISLAQAQAVVLGAVDYAARLGLAPHPGFEQARSHLGVPEQPLPALSFGRDGKPYYISGPYDDPQHVIACLTQSVGEGNFDYLVAAEPPMSDW